MEFKDFKHLIDNKLDKLTWIDYDDSSITSEEGFSVSIDYYKNIGENKDKNQLLVNVYYKSINISVVASTDLSHVITLLSGILVRLKNLIKTKRMS